MIKQDSDVGGDVRPGSVMPGSSAAVASAVSSRKAQAGARIMAALGGLGSTIASNEARREAEGRRIAREKEIEQNRADQDGFSLEKARSAGHDSDTFPERTNILGEYISGLHGVMNQPDTQNSSLGNSVDLYTQGFIAEFQERDPDKMSERALKLHDTLAVSEGAGDIGENLKKRQRRSLDSVIGSISQHRNNPTVRNAIEQIEFESAEKEKRQRVESSFNQINEALSHDGFIVSMSQLATDGGFEGNSWSIMASSSVEPVIEMIGGTYGLDTDVGKSVWMDNAVPLFIKFGEGHSARSNLNLKTDDTLAVSGLEKLHGEGLFTEATTAAGKISQRLEGDYKDLVSHLDRLQQQYTPGSNEHRAFIETKKKIIYNWKVSARNTIYSISQDVAPITRYINGVPVMKAADDLGTSLLTTLGTRKTGVGIGTTTLAEMVFAKGGALAELWTTADTGTYREIDFNTKTGLIDIGPTRVERMSVIDMRQMGRRAFKGYEPIQTTDKTYSRQ